MRIVEAARIGAFARRLDLDESDERVADCDRVVWAGLEVRHRGLANEVDCPDRQAGSFGQITDESFKRPAQLIFWRAVDGGVAQFRFRACAEGRDRGRDGLACQSTL